MWFLASAINHPQFYFIIGYTPGNVDDLNLTPKQLEQRGADQLTPEVWLAGLNPLKA